MIDEKYYYDELKSIYNKYICRYLDEYKDNPTDVFLAKHACWCLQVVNEYLNKINKGLDRKENKDFNLICDMANLLKHSELTQNVKIRTISNLEDVSSKSHDGPGIFNAPFGNTTFNNSGVYANASDISEEKFQKGECGRELKSILLAVINIQQQIEQKIQGADKEYSEH